MRCTTTVILIFATLLTSNLFAAPDRTIKVGFVRTTSISNWEANTRINTQKPTMLTVWQEAAIPLIALSVPPDPILVVSNAGLDNNTFKTAAINASNNQTIINFRNDNNYDVIILFAHVSVPPEGPTCGGVWAEQGFLNGFFTGDPNNSNLDLSDKDSTEFIIVVSDQCLTTKTTTMAHEFIHIFGGTHYVGPGGLFNASHAAVYANVGTIGAADIEKPLGTADKYSDKDELFFGDNTHDNRTTVVKTAPSVAAFRPNAPPAGAPPTPTNFITWRFGCTSDNSTIWIANWQGDSSASNYELWHDSASTFVTSSTIPSLAYQVNFGESNVQVRACNTSGCSGFSLPPAFVFDDCGGEPL